MSYDWKVEMLIGIPGIKSIEIKKIRTKGHQKTIDPEVNCPFWESMHIHSVCIVQYFARFIAQ
jgi:hypothetical protein